jgi:uncharacterized iron-regulated membrane protein
VTSRHSWTHARSRSHLLSVLLFASILASNSCRPALASSSDVEGPGSLPATPAAAILSSVRDVAASAASLSSEAGRAVSLKSASGTNATGTTSVAGHPEAHQAASIAASNLTSPGAIKTSQSPAQLFRDARGGGHPIGVVELFEWVLVLVLIAPGTFPALSCIVLACASFWRRRTVFLWAPNRPPSVAQPLVPAFPEDMDLEHGWDASKSRRCRSSTSSLQQDAGGSQPVSLVSASCPGPNTHAE